MIGNVWVVMVKLSNKEMCAVGMDNLQDFKPPALQSVKVVILAAGQRTHQPLSWLSNQNHVQISNVSHQAAQNWQPADPE